MNVSPVFIPASIFIPTANGFTEIDMTNSYLTTDFSLSQGFSYSIAGGYNLNKQIALEVSLEYWQRNKSLRGNLIVSPQGNSVSEWRFNSFNVTPTVVLRQAFNKFSLNAKAGLILAFADLQKTYIRELIMSPKTIDMRRNLNLGYYLGLEGLYQMSQKVSLSVEFGIQGVSYSPNKGKITSDFTTVIPFSEIVYKNKIEQSISADPTQRLKDSLKWNSIFAGVGLQFQF
ncbi:MAG: hypothetical protein MUE85_10545 [Microscillaceae bacterium]|jgi:hypothetical protein|nr:hypothetical protein [Microscillaceae bacterium]